LSNRPYNIGLPNPGWAAANYNNAIDLPTAGTTIADALSKLTGKFNQIGDITNGKIESKEVVEYSNGYIVPKSILNLRTGEIVLRTVAKGFSLGPTMLAMSTAYDNVFIVNTNDEHYCTVNAQVSPTSAMTIANNDWTMLTGVNIHGVTNPNINTQ
jgi:hypothetical protein